MEHDSWAPSFWRSLVALPLQSHCQGDSKRAACHLVHYHTEMVSGSREVWYLVSWNYFLSFSQVPSFLFLGKVVWRKWIAAPHVYELGFCFLFKNEDKDSFDCICVNCSWLERCPYYFSPNISHTAIVITRPSATGSWFLNLFISDQCSLLTLLPPSDMRQLHTRLRRATSF